MKKRKLHILKYNLPGIIISCILVHSIPLFAQDHYPKTEADLYLEYYKKPDDMKMLTVTATTWKERERIPLDGEVINLYLNDVSDDGYIGFVVTDEKGKGILLSSEERFSKALEGLNQYEFIALLNDKEKYEQEETRLSIQESVLEIECYEQDSVKHVKAVFSKVDSGNNLIPVSDTEINFYVQRMLGLLPVGGDYTYTDEKGMISIEFPDDLGGDASGILDIFVKVQNDESFGNVAAVSSKRWGIPPSKNERFEKRSLWGNRANAPVLLLIIANLIIFGVWLVIGYLFIQIFKIPGLADNK